MMQDNQLDNVMNALKEIMIVGYTEKEANEMIDRLKPGVFVDVDKKYHVHKVMPKTVDVVIEHDTGYIEKRHYRYSKSLLAQQVRNLSFNN